MTDHTRARILVVEDEADIAALVPHRVTVDDRDVERLRPLSIQPSLLPPR